MTGIPELINKIRTRGYRTRRTYEPKKYISSWLEPDKFERDGPTLNALVVVLRTIGCHWSRENPNANDGIITGCSMCGYINDCFEHGSSVNSTDIVYQFRPNC